MSIKRNGKETFGLSPFNLFSMPWSICSSPKQFAVCIPVVSGDTLAAVYLPAGVSRFDVQRVGGWVQVIPSRNIKPRCNCSYPSNIFDVWNPGVNKVWCEIIAGGRHRILMLMQNMMMGEAQGNMSRSHSILNKKKIS